MFVRHCNDGSHHLRHKYTKTWRKIDLPFLRDPDSYPDTWQATYKCPGTKASGST